MRPSKYATKKKIQEEHMEFSSLIQNLTFCDRIRYRLEAHEVSRVVGALVFGVDARPSHHHDA